MIGKNKYGVNAHFCYIRTIIFLIIVSFICTASILFALDESEKKINEETLQSLAFFHESLKYAYGKNLKVGDFAKYIMIDDAGPSSEVEVKVYKKEKGAFWILDRSEYGELHSLVNFPKMKLLKGYYLQDGKKDILPIVDDKDIPELYQKFKQWMRKSYSLLLPIAGYQFKKTTKIKEIKVPAGSFKCVCLEPQFSAEQTEGMMPEHIEMWKSRMRLCFSEEVPRLIPSPEMMMDVLVITDLDILEQVQGGLVKFGEYELIDYNKKRD